MQVSTSEQEYIKQHISNGELENRYCQRRIHSIEYRQKHRSR